MPISDSIRAYDIPERVAGYDSDMELMHPNRNKMLEVILEVLPFPVDASFTALDLGVGTGFFAKAILSHFPHCRLLGVDGAASMIEMARSRLGSLAERVRFLTGDFRVLKELLPGGERLDVAYSAYALHHLSSEEKLAAVSDVVSLLNPGGWFLNADLVVSRDEFMEARIQKIRIQGIVERSAGRDSRFLSAASTRAFLDDLEARDNDMPLSLEEDLHILKSAGLQNAVALWAEYREAVTGGFKP